MSRKLSGTTGSSLLATVSQRLHLKHKPDDNRYDSGASPLGQAVDRALSSAELRRLNTAASFKIVA